CDKRISSTLLAGNGAAHKPSPLFMHPAYAKKPGLESAKEVGVGNDLGGWVLPLRVAEAVMPGVVASEKGAWLAASATGQTISALVSADMRADLARGACYNDTGVEVERA